MRRYGGDLKKAKQFLLLISLIVFAATLPFFWLAPSFQQPSSSIFPTRWVCGLILFPFALVFVLHFAFKRFERLNR